MILNYTSAICWKDELLSRYYLCSFIQYQLTIHIFLNSLLCSIDLCFCSVMSDPLRPHGLPGSFIHGIFQARTLEWVAISFSKGSSQPSDWTQVSLHWQADSLPLSHQGSPSFLVSWANKYAFLLIQSDLSFCHLQLRESRFLRKCLLSLHELTHLSDFI